MKRISRKPAYLFAYTAPERQGFWIFAGGSYHRFLQLVSSYAYVRGYPRLPARVEGNCYEVPAEDVEQLKRAAAPLRVQLDFHDRVDACIQAEARKDHPDYIFGLSDPAAWLEPDASLQRDQGEEEEEREL